MSTLDFAVKMPRIQGLFHVLSRLNSLNYVLLDFKGLVACGYDGLG